MGVGELGPETKITSDVAAWLTAMQVLASEGDPRAGKALIEAYDGVRRLLEWLTGLQENAGRPWVDAMAPDRSDQTFTRVAIRRELGGGEPRPLEQLLVDRVALSWLQATHPDARYAQEMADGMTFKEGEYHQRRCERAQRQLLRAVQALATVRRLLAPTIQVNVAEKQINVAR